MFTEKYSKLLSDHGSLKPPHNIHDSLCPPVVQPRSISPIPMIRYHLEGQPVIPNFSHGLAGQHIMTVDMFSKEQLNEIFNLAQTLRLFVHKERPLDHILKVRTDCRF